MEAIISARAGKPFASIEDFIERVRHKDLNKKSLESLIKSGALDDIGERNQILINLDAILGVLETTQKTRKARKSVCSNQPR